MGALKTVAFGTNTIRPSACSMSVSRTRMSRTVPSQPATEIASPIVNGRWSSSSTPAIEFASTSLSAKPIVTPARPRLVTSAADLHAHDAERDDDARRRTRSPPAIFAEQHVDVPLGGRPRERRAHDTRRRGARPTTRARGTTSAITMYGSRSASASQDAERRAQPSVSRKPRSPLDALSRVAAASLRTATRRRTRRASAASASDDDPHVRARVRRLDDVVAARVHDDVVHAVRVPSSAEEQQVAGLEQVETVGGDVLAGVVLVLARRAGS